MLIKGLLVTSAVLNCTRGVNFVDYCLGRFKCDLYYDFDMANIKLHQEYVRAILV